MSAQQRVPRIPAQLLLQPSDPLLQSHHRTRQAENHLNTTLPPRVVNRLRLGAVHNPKIRRITRRSLLWRPTSERLPLEPWQQGLLVRLIKEKNPDQLKLPGFLWTRDAVMELIDQRFGPAGGHDRGQVSALVGVHAAGAGAQGA